MPRIKGLDIALDRSPTGLRNDDIGHTRSTMIVVNVVTEIDNLVTVSFLP